MKSYEELLKSMQEAADMDTCTGGHEKADDTIIEVALSTDLTKEQREKLVEIYNSFSRFFS